ncbi:MAG TPA: type II toxin-antitoxin system RelE/ParE family toxin [Rhodocyclaceae bacterium]|nr:type II toxin-antitoxin system RelE/ParE family toxin [Rhodocyclaceae bacterium]
MKRAILRPQARADVKAEVRYYRQHAGRPTADKLAQAIDNALQLLQFEAGIGSSRIGELLDIPDLKNWRLTGFPLILLYFEREDFLDVVRLLGERQDIPTILGNNSSD